MKVFVTRPEIDAPEMEAILRTAGHLPVRTPLLDIVFLKKALPDLAAEDRLVFTSTNGVRAWREAGGYGHTALAVGEATAKAARQAGHDIDVTAAGTVSDLVRLILLASASGARHHIHVSGAHRRGNLEADLKAAGISAATLPLYEARAAEHLPAPLFDAATAGEECAVSLLSPRTAEIFLLLAEKAGLCPSALPFHFPVISTAVADILAGHDCRNIHVAKSPNLAAMIDIIPARRT